MSPATPYPGRPSPPAIAGDEVKVGLRLGDILRVASAPQRWADRTALIWGERRFTYAEANALSNRAANALRRLGVVPGERVAVLGRNCPEYVWLYFALAKLGALLVPVNFWYRSGEIAYTLRQSGATTFVFDDRFAPQATAALAEYAGIRDVVTWGEGHENAAKGSAGADLKADRETYRRHDLRDLLAAAPSAEPDEPDVPVTPASQHIILYTSGTTGFPKGAVFSQQAHYLHAVSWALMTGQHAGDVGLLVYPLFHTGGPDCILLPHFLVGGTVVLLDGADPAAMLEAIGRHRATNIFCVPTVWRRLLAALAGGGHDVSSVQRCLGSSDTLPPDLLDGILLGFDAEVYVTYGLTEAGCILTYSRLTRDDRSKINAVGRPHPLVEISIAGGGSGEVGEVLARGPTLMDGYWDMPERTAEAFAAGWLHTGDLGHFDADGYLVLAGRAKDMIVSGGEKVYPLEVEKLIRTIPGVADVALVGVPDREWGESVLACVVRAPDEAGTALTAEVIQEHVRRRLAGYKRPRYVEFVPALPTTSATNKVQKAVLRERFRHPAGGLTRPNGDGGSKDG